jgi:hypothetical protein
MPTLLPDSIIVRFPDERAWRDGVRKIITAHPHIPVNPKGNFELVVPQSIEAWARENLTDGSYEVVTTLESSASPASGRNSGKGISSDFENPDWLAERAAQLEKDNEGLRSKMFS